MNEETDYVDNYDIKIIMTLILSDNDSINEKQEQYNNDDVKIQYKNKIIMMKR